MIDPDDDPLDGADVGETVAYSETVDLHPIDMEPDAFRGSDRIADYETTVTQLEDGTIQIWYGGEVTKTMPSRWDSTFWQQDFETDSSDRRKWVNIGFGAAVSAAILYVVFDTVISEQMLKAQPETVVGPPGPHVLKLFPVLLGLVLCIWALNGLKDRVSAL
jgi:hypothetical protein